MRALKDEPAALSIPAHAHVHSGMASFRLLKNHIHLFSSLYSALPEPPTIRIESLNS